jgi:hypothetical protein
VQGMIHETDHFIMLLNIDKVFSSNDLESINEFTDHNQKEEN